MSPIKDRIDAHRRGEATGLYSVCSANPWVLRAAMDVAREYGTPLLVEATSNQVDQFGGYTGMTPPVFRDYLWTLAHEEGFATERLILGGDHLGPNTWQDRPAQEAMALSRELIAAYAGAGFHKIHLDCSMACADDPARLPDETVAARSAELARVAEDAAAAAGHPPPVYVIGTEVPVPGGETSLEAGLQVTTPEAAAHTLQAHRLAFDAHGLGNAWERVIALVVQPGVDFDHSQVHRYAQAAAAALSAFIDGQPGLVYEAHSTDYQGEQALHALVRDHFAILKVGPAVTFALREALFALAAIEDELVPAERRSQLLQVLEQAMLDQPRHWQKHYAGDADQLRLLRRYAYSDRIRYYWSAAPVRQAVERLLSNLDAVSIPETLVSQHFPQQYPQVSLGRSPARAQSLLRHHVGLLLAQYARACHRNQA